MLRGDGIYPFNLDSTWELFHFDEFENLRVEMEIQIFQNKFGNGDNILRKFISLLSTPNT